jgi:hypothetical protein
MPTKRTRKQAPQAVDRKGKDFLTEGEMKLLLDAAKGGRYGQRDSRETSCARCAHGCGRGR